MKHQFCISRLSELSCAGWRRQGAEARNGGVHRGRPDHVWASRPLQKTTEPQPRLEAQRPFCFPCKFNFFKVIILYLFTTKQDCSLFRVGSHQGKSLSSMSTVQGEISRPNLTFLHLLLSLTFLSQSYIPGMECVVASATSATWKTCWRSARSTCWSTPPSSTSATPTAPVMFMATGQWDLTLHWKLDPHKNLYPSPVKSLRFCVHFGGKGVNILKLLLTLLCFSAKERYVRVWWCCYDTKPKSQKLSSDRSDRCQEAFPGHLLDLTPIRSMSSSLHFLIYLSETPLTAWNDLSYCNEKPQQGLLVIHLYPK